MDTNLPQNQDLIIQIKKKTLIANLFEAYTESMPQLILQLSIVLQTGNIRKNFYKSVSDKLNDFSFPFLLD
jgi:hypothetical protein